MISTCMHTHAGNRVTLTFDLLTSVSTHAQVLPYRVGPMCVRSWVLTADSSSDFSFTARTRVETHSHRCMVTLSTPTVGVDNISYLEFVMHYRIQM